MKPKNTIKLHKSVSKVINSATELVNSMIELHKLKSKPIPDYKKSGIVSDKVKETIINSSNNEVKVPEYKILCDLYKSTGEKLKAIDKSISSNTSGGGNYEPKRIKVSLSTPLATHIFNQDKLDKNIYEEWSKQLNEFLKSKSLNDSKPFGCAPIEDKEFKTDLLSKICTCFFSEVSSFSSNCKICSKPKINNFKTPITAPLGFNHDFHKGMLAADKVLQNICKGVDCNHSNVKIKYAYTNKLDEEMYIAECKICKKHNIINFREIIK